MNHNTSDDSERGPGGLPLNSVSTLTDLQVKAYENRVRERLMAKYPTLTLAEARGLEKQIQKLVQIYAEGRILLQGDPSDRIRPDHRLQGKEQTREIDITDNH
jgi:hypothetical protein